MVTFGFIDRTRASLAPMAGVTSSSYRKLCMKHGASFCCSEMVSAKALTYKDRKTFAIMDFTDLERPFGIQLFGYDPDIMAEAARIAVDYCGPDFLDINMGCPAPKITGNKSGSSLLKYPDLAERIIYAVANAVDLPVTAKVRLGWDSISFPEMARSFEDAGCAAIAVHGRTAKQEYRPPVDILSIKTVVNTVSIPVIGNGDITSPETAAAMLDISGCSAVMVGRGSQGDPFIFERIHAYLETGELLPMPSSEELFDSLFELADGLCSEKGEYIGMREMRRHTITYLKGFHGAASLRAEAAKLEKHADLDILIARIKNSQ